jgi:ABC-type multidrug transport system fused ATPase/permease subunit
VLSLSLSLARSLCDSITRKLSVVPPVVVGAVVYGKFVKKLSSKVQDSLAAASATAEDRVSQIRTVKVFAREELEDSVYGKQIDHAYAIGKKVAVVLLLLLFGLLLLLLLLLFTMSCAIP